MHYDYYELRVLYVAEEGFFCDNDGKSLSFILSPFTAKGICIILQQLVRFFTRLR